MDRTSGQPQGKLSLLRSISLKIHPQVLAKILCFYRLVEQKYLKNKIFF
jgi:hypothetical protein